MQHARDDYQRIQDPEGKIPEQEPVFLIRGQDLAGPATVEAWASQNEMIGGDPELSRLAREQATKMRQWQIRNGGKVADR